MTTYPDHSDPFLKTCVFCGDQPTNKNLEHVIPQWLIEASGPPGRSAQFGIDPKSDRMMQQPFNSWKFRACEECNRRYGELEGQARLVMHELFEHRLPDARGFEVLFDWLDKIRLTCRVAFIQRTKNHFRVALPHPLDDFIGKLDSVAYVYLSRPGNKGLQLNEPDLLYLRFPGYMWLRVNNVGIIQVADQHLGAGFLCAEDPFRSLRIDFPLETYSYLGAQLAHQTSAVVPPIPSGGMTFFRPRERHYLEREQLARAGYYNLATPMIANVDSKGLRWIPAGERMLVRGTTWDTPELMAVHLRRHYCEVQTFFTEFLCSYVQEFVGSGLLSTSRMIHEAQKRCTERLTPQTVFAPAANDVGFIDFENAS